VALKPFREVNKDPSSVGESVVRPVRLWTVVAGVSERASEQVCVCVYVRYAPGLR